MSVQPLHRIILATGLALSCVPGLSACGQKGPLTIPQTPAAAQRATLPQTVFGGSSAPTAAASAAPVAAPVTLLPPLPDYADIE